MYLLWQKRHRKERCYNKMVDMFEKFMMKGNLTKSSFNVLVRIMPYFPLLLILPSLHLLHLQMLS